MYLHFALLLFHFLLCPTLCQLPTLVGVARSLGDVGVHPVTLSTEGQYAEFAKINVLSGTASRSDPSLGVTSWNSVEQLLYYGSAEDGLASAYVTPYDVASRRMKLQRAVRTPSQTSFTLTSIQYNAFDAKIYGMVTYSSGEHFLVRVRVETVPEDMETIPAMSFEWIFQIRADFIAPGLSALDARRQVYYCAGEKESFGMVLAISTGINPGSGAAATAKVLWERSLAGGVLTSLQIDGNFGNLFGMIQNVTGHYLVQFDTEDGEYAGDYVSVASTGVFFRDKTDPATVHSRSPHDMVALSISSYSPAETAEAESRYYVFSVQQTSEVHPQRRENEVSIEGLNLGNWAGQMRSTLDPVRVTSNTTGLTPTALQAYFSEVPSIDSLERSTAHVQGGLLVTVYGSPFADTVEQLRCRFTVVDEYGAPSLQVYQSPAVVFLTNNAIICTSPWVPIRIRALLDVSLTGGSQYTQNQKAFTFFDITSRAPIVGTSKGGTLILLDGLYLRDIATQEVQYHGQAGSVQLASNVLFDSRCEFGSPPTSEAAFEMISIGVPPSGPQFHPSSCRQEMNGLVLDEVCTISCFSPPIPHEKCFPQSSVGCTEFVHDTSECPVETEGGAFPCAQLIPKHRVIGFSINFSGQRIMMPGGFAYQGGMAPVVTGAMIFRDLTGMQIEFDVDTDRARSVSAMSSDQLFRSGMLAFGTGSTAIWVLGSRLHVYFGQNPLATSETFVEIRPFTIALKSDPFQFVEGSVVQRQPTSDVKMHPLVQVFGSEHVSGCTGATIDATLTKGVGGRKPVFSWGLRSRKCADKMCINGIPVISRSTLWLVRAERQLAFSDGLHRLQVGEFFLNVNRNFHLMSANSFEWVLQARNLFYGSVVSDVDLHDCHHALDGRTCDMCFHSNPFSCPGVSNFATTPMQVHLTPVPEILMMCSNKLDTPHGPFTLNAKVLFPVDSSTGNGRACALAVPPPSVTEHKLADAIFPITWTLQELALESARHRPLAGLDISPSSPYVQPRMGNRVDHEAFNTFFRGPSFRLPYRALSPKRYYLTAVSIADLNELSGPKQSSSSIVIHTQPPVLEFSLSLSNKAIGESYEMMDNAFITFSGLNEDFWEVSAVQKDSLDGSTQVTYRWACLAVRPSRLCTLQWPQDKQCPTSYAYWKGDNMFSKTDLSATSPCPFSEDSFDSHTFNFSSRIVQDGFTYRFTLTASAVSPRDTSQPDSSRFSVGVTVLRADGGTRLESGLAIPISLRVFGQRKSKILPNEPLTLVADISDQAFTAGFETTNGECFGAGIGCQYHWNEIASDLPLSDPIMSVSPILVSFVGKLLQVSFQIKPDVVVSGARFTFELSLWENRIPFMRRGFSQITVDVNQRPRNGFLTISPAAGDAYVTTFRAEALLWEDSPDDLPLTYSFMYIDGTCDKPCQVGSSQLAPILDATFSLSPALAALNPCQLATETVVCSVLRIVVIIQDMWGAVSHASADVDLYLQTDFVSASLFEHTFSQMQRRRLLERNFDGFFQDFRNLLFLSKEPDVTQSIAEAYNNGVGSRTVSEFLQEMVDGLVNFALHEGGNLIPSTVDGSAMMMSLIIDTLDSIPQIQDVQFLKLFSIIRAQTAATAGNSTPLETLRFILSAAGSVVLKRLESLNFAGIPAGSRRMLVSPEVQDAVVADLRAEVDDLLVSVCKSTIGKSYPNGPQASIDSAAWSVTFRTSSSRRALSNFTIASESNIHCSSVVTEMNMMLYAQDVHLCQIVYKYNPVNFTSQTSFGAATSGSTHKQDNVPWPLHTSACPVSLVLIRVEDRAKLNFPRSNLLVLFNLSKLGAKMRISVAPFKNPYVYSDRTYQATCQHWDDSRKTWDATASRTHVEMNETVNFCHSDRLDPPVPSATGLVRCVYDLKALSAITGNRSHVFSPITEITDCQGAVDTPSEKSKSFWEYGQFSWAFGGISQRNVCDRCGICGGQNDCTRFCDGSLDSGKELDLCGVCGGYCSSPSCSPDKCGPLYMRYLGNDFPNNADVVATGITAGLFLKNGICQGRAPAESSFGICTNLPQNSRLERYPYHDTIKECWEHSKGVPDASLDSVCAFQPGSFAFDSVSQSQVFDLKISVLSSTNDVAVLDLLAPRGGTRINGTNTMQLRGTAPQLLRAVDQLVYFPERGVNSGFPPTKYRIIRFEAEGVDLKLDVKVRLKPVNDPPLIIAKPLYEMQEDQQSMLSPAVQVVDDADEVQGASVSFQMEVFGLGEVCLDGAECSRIISVSGSVSDINAKLSILQYVSGQNVNKKVRFSDAVRVTISDGGFGGVHPYNQIYSHVLFFNVTLADQDDHPLPFSTRSVLLFQNEKAAILGSHVTDADVGEYWTATGTIVYEGQLSSDQGLLITPLLKTRCNTSFPSPLILSSQTSKYVDQTIALSAPSNAGSTFLKLDGRLNSRKVIYLAFHGSKLSESIRLHPGASWSLSLWKMDCFDANAFPGSNMQVVREQHASGQCISAGIIEAFSVPCDFATSSSFGWQSHLRVEQGLRLGTANFTRKGREWVSLSLDTQAVGQLLAQASGNLCIKLEPNLAVNETVRFQAIGKSSSALNFNEESLQPSLELMRGAPLSYRFNDTSCTLRIKLGTGLLDQAIQLETNDEIMNILIYHLGFQVASRWSNILTDAGSNVTLAVRDVGGLTECEKVEGGFGYQACGSALLDNTTLRVMPLKKEKVAFSMQPFYFDRWLAKKSVRGEVPAYAALEDCGNRPTLEDCPSKMQILPDVVPGEYAFGRFTVEVSTRLGSTTIPSDVRSRLDFSKGSGFRDTVVRFTGFTVDVRAAVIQMVYNTPQDESVQYRNQFSDFYNPSNSPCNRPCFLQDVGPRVFSGEDDAAGCQQSCAQLIFDRVNAFLPNPALDEKGIFLDDAVITFTDNGVTGVGLKKFTSVQLYNIYTLAVNDRPCVVFQGKASSGCRERCAHMGQPSTCFDSGLPFDLSHSINITMTEGQQEPILLGGLVVKIVDEYDSVTRDCFFNLSDTLSLRGDDTVDPPWLSECPRFSVILNAENGEIALNSREFVEFFAGQSQRFASELAFLGFPVDSNAATRMLRLRMSESQRNFNSNLGKEIVSLSVSDQGFSGSDSTGEFDGTTAVSTVSFEVVVRPVNNPPEISVPRAEDPLEPVQNQNNPLAKIALDPGLEVVDRDADECGGKIVMKLGVMFGTLSVATSATPGIDALSPSQAEKLDFFADWDCREEDCSSIASIEACINLNKCAFSIRLNQCTCKKTRPGQNCRSLKMRGPQQNVGQALQVLVYTPLPNTNYFTNILDFPEGDVLQMEVSDKNLPDDSTDQNFNCGEILHIQEAWQTFRALLQTSAVSQPCTSSFNPVVHNPGFEHPTLCQGLFDCTQQNFVHEDSTLGCVGVEFQISADESGWSFHGMAGISHEGWFGDVVSIEGSQHLFLAPTPDRSPASVSQMVQNFVLGGTYRVTIRVGSRLTPNFGASFELVILDNPRGDWSDWAEAIPTIKIEEVRPTPGQPFTLHSTSAFLAYSSTYGIMMSSSLDPRMDPQHDRMVFVDDLQVSCLQYNFMEDDFKVLSSVRILDPDYTDGVVNRLGRQGLSFVVRVQVFAQHGVFNLVSQSSSLHECFIMPPSRLMQDIQRIRWGYHCATYNNDVSASVWANMTLFRPDCPAGWTGLGTTVFPCVKLKLTSITLSLTPFNDALLPFGQSQIPTREMEVEGTLDEIQDAFHTYIQYVPDMGFNTINLGGEQIIVRTNDLGMYNGVSAEEEASLKFYIEAVNDRPNVTFRATASTMMEDSAIALLGVELRDEDLDEVPCPLEPCTSALGTIQMRVQVSNGTVSVSEAATVSFSEILMSVFGSVSRSPRVHDCFMRMSCNPNGGFLTLKSSTLEHMCGKAPSSRCKQILQYCALADLALSDLQISDCQQIFAEEDLDLANVPGLDDLDVEAIANFAEVTEGGGVVKVVRQKFMILIGHLGNLQQILDQGLLKYRPAQYQNGDQNVEFTVHDQGNVGIGFPCDSPPDIPHDLLFAYCKQKAPIVLLEETKTMTVRIEPVNNLPELEVYDEDGRNQIEKTSLRAVKNTTKRLNRMVVFDPDIQETLGCTMKVGVTTRSGGIVFFNSSLSPLLKYTPSPTLTSLSVEGSLDEVNTFMANINYRPDAQFLGQEDIVVDMSDSGCTGIANANQQIVTIVISILVDPPDTCQYETCRSCTQQTVQTCGWCPSSCKGAGKCRKAEFRGGPTSVGECLPLCTLGACVAWNMCAPAGDRSWEIGAICGPLLYVILIGCYLVSMWARRVHGTIPIYVARSFRITASFVPSIFFVPQQGSRAIQISFLAVSTIVFVVAFVVGGQVHKSQETFSLGEASSFLLNTDACSVVFMPMRGKTFRDPLEVSMHVSANSSLENVMLQTDFCDSNQFIFVNNTREALNRYKGYFCGIQINVPEDPNHVAPVMEISNKGNSATTIRKASDSAVINFGANMFSISGTMVEMTLSNVKMRRFAVPLLESGFLMLQNATFQSIGAKTVGADVLVSVSQDADMMVPYSIIYKQSSNKVCFVSRNDSEGDNLFTQTDGCHIVCKNDTTGVSATCVRSCTQASTVRLAPYKRNLQPGLKGHLVDLESATGQLFFSAIASDRLPPASGRHLLDNVHVYDGLGFPRIVGLSRSALSLVQDAFHHAKESRPIEELLKLELQGPGRPQGYFVWVADPRYMAMSKWSLFILSLGMLNPSERVFKLPFTSSACPAFDLGVDSQSKYSTPPVNFFSQNNTITSRFARAAGIKWTGDDERKHFRRSLGADGTAIDAVGNTVYLRHYYELLYAALGGDEFPAGSIIAYKPVANYRTFRRDVHTNSLSMNQVGLLDFPLTLALLIIGLIGPVLVALSLASSTLFRTRKAIAAFSISQVQQEVAARDLLDFRGIDTHGTRQEEFQAGDHLSDRIESQRSFFYFVDMQIGNPDVQQSFQVNMLQVISLESRRSDQIFTGSTAPCSCSHHMRGFCCLSSACIPVFFEACAIGICLSRVCGGEPVQSRPAHCTTDFEFIVVDLFCHLTV